MCSLVYCMCVILFTTGMCSCLLQMCSLVYCMCVVLFTIGMCCYLLQMCSLVCCRCVILFTSGVCYRLPQVHALAYCRCVSFTQTYSYLLFTAGQVCAVVYSGVYFKNTHFCCRCVVFNNRGNGGAELLVSSSAFNPF